MLSLVDAFTQHVDSKQGIDNDNKPSNDGRHYASR